MLDFLHEKGICPFWPQNITFDDFIITLCSTNITCDCTFATFGSFLIFFFFTFYGIILTLRNINIICDCTFVTFGGSFIFFTFDGTIITLCSTNIKCDCTFGGSFIFFLTFDGFIVISGSSTSHLIVFFSHSVIL